MSTTILIPARLNSTRFPNKPLAPINGEKMVHRVLRLCKGSVEASTVRVLTDSMRIVAALPEGDAYLSDAEFSNGTERCAAYVKELKLPDHSMVAIVQGDEVALSGRDIDYAISKSYPHCVTTIIGRLPGRLPTEDDVFVRTAPTGTVVEWQRGDPSLGYHHVGVYITSVSMLQKYASSPRSPAEIHERLEQHRWESIGVSVQAVYLPIETESINRPHDIGAAERLICQSACTWVGEPGSK